MNGYIIFLNFNIQKFKKIISYLILNELKVIIRFNKL